MASLSLVPDHSGEPTWDVEITLGVAHVAVAQAVATALAIDLDFDLEAVDDIRIATNEVCTELVEHADPRAVLHLVFEARKGAFEMAAELESEDCAWIEHVVPDVVRALTDTVTRSSQNSDVDGRHILRTWFRKARNHRRIAGLPSLS